jgi:diadenosine tetraphosphate (Ap4A) HIT family hydrolase
VSADDCPACAGRWPRADHRIADLGPAVAYLNEDQFFPGWTILVLKRHATELFQLTPDERARLIEVVSDVARVLGAAVSAVKMNYELLGNQIPHVHWHVVPRRADDPAPGAPSWVVEHAPRLLAAPELQARLRLIRQGLAG